MESNILNNIYNKRRVVVMKFKLTFFLSLFLFSLPGYSAVVGSVADARFGDNWTLDGTDMVDTRAKILQATNFGPGGTYPEALTIMDIAGAITPAVLTNIDVFFVGFFDDASVNAFTANEENALIQWVTNGEIIILTCDSSTFDQLCTAFGHPNDGTGSSPFNVEATQVNHPLFNGPFGSMTTINAAGSIGYFATPNGATVLARESSGSAFPAIMEQTMGSGLVLLLGDVDTISTFGGFLSAGTGISTDNDKFLGNLFAYAVSSSNSQGPGIGPATAIPSSSQLSQWLLIVTILSLGILFFRHNKT